MRVALKTVQQDERGISWTSPLHVVELQAIDGDKFILSEGGQAHSALLSRSHYPSVCTLGCFHTLIRGTCQGARKQGTTLPAVPARRLGIRLCTCRLPRAILQFSGKTSGLLRLGVQL